MKNLKLLLKRIFAVSSECQLYIDVDHLNKPEYSLYTDHF